MKFAFVAAAAVLSASSAFAARCYGSGNFTKTQFPNCKEFSPTFAAHWGVADGTVTLGLNVDVDQGNWFAFGISENGGMNGADIVALINKDGKWTANDLFTSTYALPVADKSQDWKLVQEPLFAADKTASTILSRKLRTCDDSDHEIKAGQDYPVIWAIGTSPDLKVHAASNRGNSMINFQKTAFQLSEEKKLAEADRSSYKTLDLRIPEITMPKKLTTYMCVNFELPSDQKYHVVEYEALVPKNDYTLHHIQVNQCTSKPQRLKQAYECGSAGFEAGCSTMVIIWGPGVDKVQYPSAAGLPIGKGVTQWLNFQFHYNNANGVSNYKDNSGIRLVYTAKLRPNDIGIAVLGPTNLNLPKGRTDVESPKSVCKYGSGPDVTLISNEFHMHARGKKMNTFHVRSGKELAPLGDRAYYDYRFQGTSLIPEDASIMKAGDQLITFCTFDTSQMTYDLKWGEGSDQEMCFQFVQYYPRSASMCSGGGGSATFTKYEAPKCTPS